MSFSFVDALSLVRQMPVGEAPLFYTPRNVPTNLARTQHLPHSTSTPSKELSDSPPSLRLGKNLPLQVSPLGSHPQTSVSLEKLQKQAGFFLQVQVKGASSFPRVDFGNGNVFLRDLE